MACKPEHVSLPLCCGHCGAPVDVTYERTVNPDVLPKGEYRCPFCKQLNGIGRIPGRVVNVTDRPTKR